MASFVAKTVLALLLSLPSVSATYGCWGWKWYFGLCDTDPETTPPPPDVVKHCSVYGDPHVKRWDRKPFPFHGQCDLIMVQGNVDGKHLEVQIRTTIYNDAYANITQVGIKYGATTVVYNSSHVYYEDDHETGNLELGHNVTVHLDDFVLDDSVTREFINSTWKVPEGELEIYKKIDLTEKSMIEITHVAGLFSVSIHGDGPDFVDTEGLCGDFAAGKPFDRNGHRFFFPDKAIDLDEHEDATRNFAQAWTVGQGAKGQYDVSLFDGGDQGHCTYPSTTASQRRRQLRGGAEHDAAFLKAAEDACADADPDSFDACMSDVLYTGRPEIAFLHKF